MSASHTMRMRSRRMACILVACCLSPLVFSCGNLCYAQSNASMQALVNALGITPPDTHNPIFIGLGGSGVFNAATSDLVVYRPNSVSDPNTLAANFKGGNSVMPDLWMLYERPLGATPKSFWIAPRLHVFNMSGQQFSNALDHAATQDPQSGKPVAANRDHVMTASLLGLGVDLFFRYPLPASVYVFGGGSAYWLLQSKQEEVERILSPSNAVFVDNGASEQTLSSGPIPNVRKLQASYTVGGHIDIELAHRLFFAPEASITFPITDVRTDLTWRLTRVTIAGSIKYDIASDVPPPPPLIVERAPIRAILDGKIDAHLGYAGISDSAGMEIERPNLQLRVEETEQVELFPMLNSVFFDDGVSVLPSRYVNLSSAEAHKFRIASLNGMPDLNRYWDVLNVIGRRMNQHPMTSVMLTGFAPSTTGSSTASGRAADTLATARAESVKKYLVDKWNIEPSRLRIGHRQFDPTGLSPEAYQEGNHVSITTDSLPIIEPLRLSSVTRALNVPKLRIKTSYDSRYPLSLYSVSLMQGSRVLAQFNNAPAQSDTGIHTWAPSESQLPATDEALTISLNLRDSVGTTFSTTDTARIEQLTIKKKREIRQEDTIIERYNLVTFELDKADLDALGQSIIQEIGRHITAGDKVRLRGYTDLLGDPAHNYALSESRAQSVKNALFAAVGPELAGKISIDATGVGRTNLVDNRLPEGRFLSRTVQVLIERAVK